MQYPNPSSNGVVDADTSAQAQQFLDSMQSVNLDEITTETIAVAIREYDLIPIVGRDGEPITDENGKPRMRKKAWTRIAEIENFVPMKVFNKMLVTRERVTRARKKYLEDGGAAGNEGDPIIPWMEEQVLNVWKLTEEDMTLERLESGLPFQSLTKLFASFFGEILQKSIK